jgi:adenylosuccinate lyase
MRANLDEAVLSERAVFELGIERQELAQTTLRDALSERLTGAELEAALDPVGYVGSAAQLVDRALAFAESEPGE